MEQLSEKAIHRASEITVHTFGHGFVEEVAEATARRNALSLTITERQLYLGLDGRTFVTAIEQHQLAN